MQLIDIQYKMGAFPLFQSLNATFHSGIIGIIGANGSGKSTLLLILSGLCKPDAGQILFEARDIYAYPSSWKTKVGYVPATPHLYPFLTIEENIYFAAALRKISKETFQVGLQKVLAQCLLQGYEKVLFGKCSQGIKKRAMLAVALIHQPQILILDEPCAELDPLLRLQIWLLLQQLRSEGKTIIFSSHHPEEISAFCCQRYQLQQGKLKLISKQERLTDKSQEAKACATLLVD